MLRWLSIVELHSKEKLIVNELVGLKWTVRVEDERHTGLILVQLVCIYFGSKLDHMSESDDFFSVSYEECLGDKRRILIENLRL